MTARRGFSVVELMMVIGVIGILISVVVPAIEGVQHAARQTASLANLRQCVGVALSYTSDYDGMMPCYTDPSLETVRVVRWQGIGWTLDHMRAENWWNIALADAYLDGDATVGAAYSPWNVEWNPKGSGEATSHYWYSCTFQAAPEFFAPETRWITGRSQLRAVRADEVDHASYKAVFTCFFRSAREQRDDAWEMGFADGSAGVAQRDNRGPQYGPPYKGDWWPGKTEDFGHDWHVCPGMHTLHGCRGRDVRGR